VNASDNTPTSPVTPPTDLARVNETLRTRYWSWILRSDADGPRPLLDLLKERLPHIPADSWPERFEFGGIYVNGLEALSDMVLPLPSKIEYYEPKFDIGSAHAHFSPFKDEYVLFNDDAIAIVYKPPHLSSMPAKEQRHFSLKASLEKHFQRPIHMPSRLDVSAQGLVVVSISPAAHAGLQRAFETRAVHKTYRCASHVRSSWPEQVVDFNIAVSPEHPVLRVASTSEGQTAQTRLVYSHSSTSEEIPVHVYTANPITGRTHQIRVHAAASGLSLVGDNFYGGTRASYLHLASCALTLPHPITGATVFLSLPEHLSPAWVWP
jgi:23S rRNA-/tRNA-specific pseudouridylate synthase